MEGFIRKRFPRSLFNALVRVVLGVARRYEISVSETHSEREFETQFEKHGFSLSTHKSGNSSVSREYQNWVGTSLLLPSWPSLASPFHFSSHPTLGTFKCIRFISLFVLGLWYFN